MSTRLTAKDVENQEFPKAMRGYSPAEVDLYLKSVAEEIERLNLENGRLAEELGSMKREIEGYRSREQTLQATLVSAQSMTEELKQRAQSEAELIVAKARLEAERLLKDSHDELSSLESEVSRCKLERDLFEKRLRSMLEEHQEILDRRKESGQPLDNLHLLRKRPGSEAG